MFHQVHTTDRYVCLESMEPGEKAVVFFNCHNPHVSELLSWHPRRADIEIRDLRVLHPTRPRARKAVGMPVVPETPGPRDGPVVYYPSPADLEILGAFPARPYVVFGPSASAASRNVPVRVAREAAQVASELEFTVVLSGRNYQRRFYNRGEAHAEVRLPDLGIVDTIDRLSVPGVGRLMENAAAVFCAHSAHAMLAWSMGKPTYCLVDPSGWAKHFSPCGPYAFGAMYRENCTLPFAKWEPEHFRHFLRSTSSYAASGRPS